MYLIVCYDIVENKRRTRLHKAMKGYLDRVQKSVFEGELEPSRLDKMREIIWKIIDPEIDTVRIYHLCGQCRPRTEILGTGVIPASEEDWVV